MIARVQRSQYFGETVAVPSKSQAHRLLIAAALKKGRTVVRGVGNSDDVNATIRCLAALGAEVIRRGDDVTVRGIEKAVKGGVLNAGESGSTLRFLLPVAAALNADCVFEGQGRLLQRPNQALCRALNDNGAQTDGVRVSGKLKGGDYVIDATVSSQYISGLLFALPLLDEDSRILFAGAPVSKNYIDMTVKVLSLAKIEVKRTENGFVIPGGQKFDLPEEVICEGDWSGAAFILTAGALGKMAKVKGLDIDSLQGDKRIADILRLSGAKVSAKEGTVEVVSDKKIPFEVDIEDIPDLAPVLAVLAATLPGESRLKSVRRLQLKESDRLAAIQEMLSNAGIESKREGDDLVISGGNPHSGRFDGKADHRMVMSSVLLAGISDGVSEVTDAEAVKKSYPNFFEDYKKIGGQCHVEVDG